nr:MAG TPA: hypothetical protein [Caudoviricetes sp.]
MRQFLLMTSILSAILHAGPFSRVWLRPLMI